MNDINKLSLRIPLEGTINTRDLGGFETSDKRHIKYKRIIRTDNLSRLTPKDISYFHNVLDARFDVDFTLAKDNILMKNSLLIVLI